MEHSILVHITQHPRIQFSFGIQNSEAPLSVCISESGGVASILLFPILCILYDQVATRDATRRGPWFWIIETSILCSSFISSDSDTSNCCSQSDPWTLSAKFARFCSSMLLWYNFYWVLAEFIGSSIQINRLPSFSSLHSILFNLVPRTSFVTTVWGFKRWSRSWRA